MQFAPAVTGARSREYKPKFSHIARGQSLHEQIAAPTVDVIIPAGHGPAGPSNHLRVGALGRRAWSYVMRP